MNRPDLLAGLEQEVGVMVRRIRRIIRERASAVHPDLQPSSYLLLGWLIQHGPQRGSAVAEQFDVDKGAISRQIQHLQDLGLVDRSPDPDDGRATLVAASATAVERLALRQRRAPAVARRAPRRLVGRRAEYLRRPARQLQPRPRMTT